MKSSVLLKSLIDIFFFIHVIGIISFPLGFMVKNIDEPQLLDWMLFAVDTICYLFFLIGLFFLRKMARSFLSQKYFSKLIVANMKISGNSFFYAGMISVLTLLLCNLFDFDYKPVYKTFSIAPMFLIIIGLFFAIQSKTLSLAIKLKNENDLTV